MTFDTQTIIKETKVRLCLDCGKCTSICPVNRYDAAFNPRLIVQKALGHVKEQDRSIWSCINCNLCTERCNYNVKFTDFIRFLRYQKVKAGVDIDYSHGCTPQTVMHIMGGKNIEQKRLEWLPADIKPNPDSDTAFFVGCAPYFDVLFADIKPGTVAGTIGAMRLLGRANVPFNLLDNERCCGRDLLLTGDLDGFLALANTNLQEFQEHGIRNIITSCPECYYTLKIDYPRFVDKWDINVKHITEIITPAIETGKITGGRLDKKITFHDPCTLGRYSRIFEPPRAILNTINGIELVEMKDSREKALCCGSSPWVACGSVNKQIQKERLAQALDSGAEMLVTACPKCKIHLVCAQRTHESDLVPQIEIRDMYELLDIALATEEVRSA